MKTRTLYRLLGLLVVPLFYFVILAGFKTGNTTAPALSTGVSNTVTKPTPVPGGRNFVNCIFNGGIWDTRPGDWIEHHLDTGWYNELNFNTVHLYDYINRDVNGTDYYGRFETPLDTAQINHTNGLLGLTGSKNLDILLERSKISKLCYAQRVVYEAEGGNNGFSYQSRLTDPIQDSGRMVVKGCASCPPSAPAGLLVSNIYENLQHTDLPNFNAQYADGETWFMKPMMRIDSSVVDNYPEREVVRIDVIPYNDGAPCKSVVIRAKHFGKLINGEYRYGGQYIDIYDFGNEPVNLEVSGSRTDPNGLGYQMTEWYPNWVNGCKIDFKVHWYGTVDVWFDKMTVDDKWANTMFAPAPNNFDSFIEEEVTNFGSNPDLYSFFADECTYSNAPCIRYVDSVMKSYNPDARLHIALTNFFSVLGLKDPSKCSYILEQNPGLYSVNPDAHQLMGPMPPQFNDADRRFPARWKSTSNEDYNYYLQHKAFGDRNSATDKLVWDIDNRYQPTPEGSLVNEVVLTKNMLTQNAPNTKMIVQPQIQLWAFYSTYQDRFLYGQREPTNEEIQAQAMLSIAHGADGICWFWYNSETWPTYTHTELNRRINYIPPEYQNYSLNASDSFMVLGLINTEKEEYTKRTSNLYGQDKWNYVKDMNAKIAKWKPTLDNITWSSGWSVHSEGSNHEFIENFVSIVPHLSGQNPCVTDGPGLGEFADCPEESYWEMGFFGAPASERNTKYFMLVNRRCVPEDASHFTPDNRFVKIKFNTASLPGSWKSWQISEVGGNTSPINFNKNSGYINLGTTAGSMGWFKPGEGKMFKITPTGVTGGDLVCDEVITGETFTCEDTIFSNGYNITIGAGTNMKFTDSSCIVMNGGVFTMGDQQVSGPQNITFNAASGNSWRGHSFTGTEVHIYGASFTGLANDSVYALNLIDCPVVDIRNTTLNTAGTSKRRHQRSLLRQ